MDRLLLFVVLSSTFYGIVYETPSPLFQSKMEVAGMYIEHEGKILLLHRQDDRSEGNCWGVPGGKSQSGETPLPCAVRETWEETGCDLSDQPVIFVKTVYIELDPTLHVTYHILRASWPHDPATVAIRFCEHKGFTWVTIPQALQLSLMQDEDVCLKLAYPELDSGT